MGDPFSPNRFIHEVESLTNAAVRTTVTGRVQAQQSRRKADRDDEETRDTDRGSTSHSSHSRAKVQHRHLATTVTNHNHACSLSPRSVAVLCGVVASLLFWFIYTWNPQLSPSPRPRDIEPAVKAYIDRAITRALRDPVGRRDFALLADGAIVLPELTKLVTPKGVADLSPDSSPDVAMNDDMRIGNCWSVAGSTVQLGLRLSTMIHPTHVSIDHIPFEIAADIGRAPRRMLLWGGVDGEMNQARLRNIKRSHHVAARHARGRTSPKTTRGYAFVLLGSFEYDIRASSHVQTFALEPDFAEAGMYFGVVVLEMTSNWGANSTCLYRFRVHGDTYD